MPSQYNLKNIRALLINGFSENELRAFCFDEANFEEMYNQLPRHASSHEIIQLLLDYARRKSLLANILAWAKAQNRAMYERHQPYLVTTNAATDSEAGRESQKGAHTAIEEANINALLTRHRRRLQKLKEQQALQGISTDPAILLQIEDIEVEIKKLEAQLEKYS